MKIFFFWLVFSIAVGVMASKKGHSGVLYFLLAAVASPLVGIIVVLLLKPNEKEVEKAKLSTGQSKKCPFCAEIIKAEASVCRFCGREMPRATVSSLTLPPAPQKPAAPSRDEAKDIYVTNNGTEQGPYSRTQIRTMWNAGAVTTDSLYWRDGMQKWQPVMEII